MRRTAIALAAAASVLLIAGCGAYGESHGYNAPAPSQNITPRWVRIESPGNYHTIIRACTGNDGIYLDQSDNNSVTVVPDDPECR